MGGGTYCILRMVASVSPLTAEVSVPGPSMLTWFTSIYLLIHPFIFSAITEHPIGSRLCLCSGDEQDGHSSLP